MFERKPSAVDLDDAAVVDALIAAGREENAACARRLASIGELWARRMPEDEDAQNQWAIDGFDNVVAEVGAALGISRGRAKAQLEYAIVLRDRLPRFAELFATGVIDFRLMATVVSRTDLVEDPELLGRLDALLAKHSPKWMKFSGPKLAERIDAWVARFDPAGVRVPNPPTDNRYVHLWAYKSGMASMNANIPLPQAEFIDQRLDELADTVCPDDPRTRNQRRADALGALAAQHSRLACGCGSPACVAASDGKSLGQIVINVLADQETLHGTSDAPGYLPGWGPIPADQVRDLAATAKFKPLRWPSDVAEPGYRPSKALADFVRARDLTCRFPDCDKPAEFCDLDHTTPWPHGPTHPSNVKCVCRYHHLLKTFYTGIGGWDDVQLPDGTVTWTSPSGRTYTTTPGGAIFFPQLAVPTGDLVLPTITHPPDVDRAVMMPRRKRPRAKDRQYRIAAERRINEIRIAEEQRQREEWLAASYVPPPF